MLLLVAVSQVGIITGAIEGFDVATPCPEQEALIATKFSELPLRSRTVAVHTVYPALTYRESVRKGRPAAVS